MHYIRRVHVEHPGTSNEHISQVQYSSTTSGLLRRATREQVHTWITAGYPFRSHHDGTRAQADVLARESSRGTRYIATEANGRETDNLLRLPRY